jgi:hypothetical protein
MTRDLAWACFTLAAYLVGILVAVAYVLRGKKVRTRPPALFRSELPTLTGVTITEALEGLAAKCREKGR